MNLEEIKKRAEEIQQQISNNKELTTEEQMRFIEELSQLAEQSLEILSNTKIEEK